MAGASSKYDSIKRLQSTEMEDRKAVKVFAHSLFTSQRLVTFETFDQSDKKT